ncbi:phage integrase SAM-like domain-containing protein [Halalkalibaculum sp. DA3122]|uniref:phage integrase SAM-like domain-containing protein n=1 Tax=Halalkalibaculum sp. DA3122 TaxID=3373607 RepID=UPI003754BE4D
MFKPLNISYTVRKNKARANGEVPIYMRLSVDGKISEISAGQTVDPTKWDSENYRVQGRSKKAKSINRYLGTLEFKANQAHQQLLQEGAEITSKAVKLRMTGKDREEEPVTVMEVFKQHNKKMKSLIGNKYSESTHKKYRTAKKHVKAFLQEHYDNEEYPISDVDQDFLEEFAHYLMTKDDPCSNNSARKYLSNFQKIVNRARSKGWLNSDPYKHFDMQYKKKDPVFLSQDELKRIERKELDVHRLDQVRDVFVFSCYTGLGFSDAEKLTKADVKEDENGDLYLYQPRTKTGNNASVLLLPKAIEIISKYEDHPETQDGSLLPMISNQKTNAYLKEIATLCKVDKKLTHHVARHTCATMFLTNGVPVETVQKVLGHSDLRSTMHYARVTPDKVNSDMSDLIERLESVS